MKQDAQAADLQLIVATDSDVPAVVELINRAFRGHGEDSSWSTEEHYIEGTRTTAEMLREEIAAHPDARLLLWREPDDTLLGCVWMQPEENDVWYLGSLSVVPRQQNAGLGRRLLAAAEDWALERGAQEIKMTVVQVRTALLEWYARRGYLLTEETKPFPYGDDRFGRPTRDDLYFVVLRKQFANDGVKNESLGSRSVASGIGGAGLTGFTASM
jgi:GNAT superfamily N-acetyltransferase